jgi:hypothetical protein
MPEIEIPDALGRSLDRVAARMTPIIRNRALEAGWPEHVASRLSMIRTANGIAPHVDESVRQQAEDLEFGSMSSAPRSALSTLESAKTKQEVARISRDSMDDLINQVRRVFE